jgi:rhamnulose-1-phosphate aldolase/alcohol dehydrogenase
MNSQAFRYVDHLWDTAHASALGDDQVALFLYRSNLLGADLRITNYGGGNTSCRTVEEDPLTSEEVEVLWIKGSGGDIGTLDRDGVAGLYLNRLQSLKQAYRGIDHEDDMVALLYHCLYDLDSRAPSIDTPLHGLLPFSHIDHLHPDALIAVAAAKDGEAITEEIWGGAMGWVPWQRPGFDLGIKLEACLAANPGIRGIVLGGHGLFTWGDTSLDCYLNSLGTIEQASKFVTDRLARDRPVFGGEALASLPEASRRQQAAKLAPILRGLCSSEKAMIGHFADDERVLEFINSRDLARLAPLGTSCPDHFLRTKIQPLVLNLEPDEDLSDVEAIRETLLPSFERYRSEYQDYYEACKNSYSPAMRDANPVVILYPGIGMFTFAKNKQTARVASEFYVNAINVMRGAEALSEYTALPRQEAFDIEYWLLEEAKLQRQPAEKPLSRKVALVTGSAGGIGKAVAAKFIEEGACVVLSDIDLDRLEATRVEFLDRYGRDASVATVLDVTSSSDAADAFDVAALEFGGVDILVNNAGISISRALEDYTEEEYDLLLDVLAKGQFLVSQAGVRIMKKQGMGGDIVNIVSKNGVVAGPKNLAYGTAKAAQAHMTRLMAAELGDDGIRVNMVNPDAVIEGSNIWASGWAEERAEAYGVSLEELPAFYARRTLLNEVITPCDIADGVFAFVCGLLTKSTGCVLNVDGGLAAGFVR